MTRPSRDMSEFREIRSLSREFDEEERWKLSFRI
jgi:hypothetical protein